MLASSRLSAAPAMRSVVRWLGVTSGASSVARPVLECVRPTAARAPGPGGFGPGRRRGSLAVAFAAKSKRAAGGGAASSGLLSGVHPENLDACARILERAQSAADQWRVDVTEFLDPALANAALTCIARMADCDARPWGGHDRAERVRLLLGRPESLDAPPGAGGLADRTDADADAAEAAVALLDVKGNFLFDPADHRDFLGAALGTGIDRDRLGDILVQGERGAQILCTPEMATFLSAALTSVRSVPVTCARASLDDLRVPPPRVDTFTSVEASMRLDAVASAGFRMSRGKMSDLIAAGAVRVNWREGAKPKTTVKEGDVISLRGKGRVEVGEVGETKKGKFSVELTRYL